MKDRFLFDVRRGHSLHVIRKSECRMSVPLPHNKNIQNVENYTAEMFPIGFNFPIHLEEMNAFSLYIEGHLRSEYEPALHTQVCLCLTL